MTKLLWLCVIALGCRMLYEMSFDFGRVWGDRLRRFLRWAAWCWVVYFVSTVIWWGRTFGFGL